MIEDQTKKQKYVGPKKKREDKNKLNKQMN